MISSVDKPFGLVPGAQSAQPGVLVSTATQPSIDIDDSPGGAVVSTLQNPQDSGAPLVLRILQNDADWLQVRLRVRLDGSTGWVKAADETISRVD